MSNHTTSRLIFISIIIGICIFAVLNICGMGIENMSNQPQKAIAVLFPSNQTNKKISGYVTFTENKQTKTTLVKANLKGLPPNKKLAWHVHEFGDLRDMKTCMSTGGHYNPSGKTHGGPHDINRHIGDFGNLKVNSQGKSTTSIRIKGLLVSDKNSILGRSLIIHAGEDDLGRGGDEESKKTGNAGKRIACSVIGRMNLSL